MNVEEKFLGTASILDMPDLLTPPYFPYIDSFIGLFAQNYLFKFIWSF